MSVHDFVRPYLRIHPVGIRNAVRLYSGFGSSLLMKVLVPGRFTSWGLGRLIPGKSHLTVSVGGVRANIRPGTHDLDLLSPTHEPLTSAWFQVKKGDVVVDAGAHIGRYALMAAKHASQVIAIEPDPSNFSLLEANVKLNGFSNVQTFPLALSNRRGPRLLYLGDRPSTGTSSLEPEWGRPISSGTQGTWQVECDTLDRIVDSLGLKVIDWLKIDVEGHEVFVLEGAQSTLTNVRHVILEVARGNETACRDLLTTAGLGLVSVEAGLSTNNWLLSSRFQV